MRDVFSGSKYEREKERLMNYRFRVETVNPLILKEKEVYTVVVYKLRLTLYNNHRQAD